MRSIGMDFKKRLFICALGITAITSYSQSAMTNEGGSGLVLYVGNITVHCDDDFTNGASGNLEFAGAGSPELQVDGDYTINSASTFTVGISEIEMTGGAAQNFDSGGKDHYHVNINNSSGGVSLNGNALNITNTLTFTAGHLILGIRNCVVESTASIVGGTKASFAVPASTGVFTIESIGGAGTHLGSVEFPVGYSPISTAYTPIEFENNPGTVGDFSVRMDDDILDGGTSGSVISTYVVDRTWHVTTTSGSPSVIVKGTWHSGQEIGGFNRTQCYFSRWVSGTTWNQVSIVGNAVDEGGGFYSHTTTNRHTTVTKPWAIASNNQLPIELIEFNAIKQDESVELNWVTGSEINNDFFIVEKSNDGETFKEILEVDGAGNSTDMISYEELDKDPFNGINYYRLKQVDFDGTFTYSDIKTVVFEADGNVLTQIFPNPSVNTQVEIQTTKPSVYRLRILNEHGQELFNAMVPCFEGNNIVPLNFDQYATGVYYIQVYNELGYNKVHTFTKQ